MPPRDRCYDCFRPMAQCLCGWVQRVENRTEILILQHPKERAHAFNTARLTDMSLARSELHAAYTPDLAADPELAQRVAGAGLLYPGDGAIDLSALGESERPSKLVVLDGTWWHARGMLRDVPALGALQRYTLPGGMRSGFLVRQQPSEECLSTIEAVAASLKLLEPETEGLDAMLRPFHEMQRLHLSSTAEPTPRTRKAPRPKKRALSPALTLPADSLVLVYVEMDPWMEKGLDRKVVAVAAARLGSAERWSRRAAGRDALLTEWPDMRLDAAAPEPMDEIRARWSKFLRPTDTVIAWNGSTLSAVHQHLGPLENALELRPVYRSSRPHRGDLDAIVLAEELPAAPANSSRALERLHNLETALKRLRGDS